MSSTKLKTKTAVVLEERGFISDLDKLEVRETEVLPQPEPSEEPVGNAFCGKDP